MWSSSQRLVESLGLSVRLCCIKRCERQLERWRWIGWKETGRKRTVWSVQPGAGAKTARTVGTHSWLAWPSHLITSCNATTRPLFGIR